MFKTLCSVATAIVVTAGSALAVTTTTVDVDANKNVWNGGKGLDNILNTDPGASTGIVLSLGDSFQAGVSATDTWNICDMSPRCTVDADGIRPHTGTRIGVPYTNSGFTSNFGSLVGRVGLGDFFLVGTAGFAGTADADGELRFYHWDGNRNNFGTIAVTATTQPTSQAVSPVPLPASLSLMLGGLLGMRMLRRRS